MKAVIGVMMMTFIVIVFSTSRVLAEDFCTPNHNVEHGSAETSGLTWRRN